MEQPSHIDQTIRKEPYIKPILTSHAPLRDLTAFQSDCSTIFNFGLARSCRLDHHFNN